MDHRSRRSPRRGVRWLFVATLAVCALLAARAYTELPRHVRLLPQQEYNLPQGLWFRAVAPAPVARAGQGEPAQGAEQAQAGDGSTASSDALSVALPLRAERYPRTLAFASSDDEPLHLEWRFLGIVPVGVLRVEPVPEVAVLPGGQAIGVLMNGDGLLINRIAPVTDVHGRRRFPAEESGLRPGDIIAEVAGRRIHSPLEVARLVQEFGRRGQALPLVILRDGVRRPVAVRPVPVFDEGSGRQRYMLGLFLQDPVAGVGTLTFYHPVTGRYGALGHVVTGGGPNPLSLSTGHIVAATIHGIQRSARGRPGEKIGRFDYGGAELGTIEKNNTYGIFGRLKGEPPGAAGRSPVPIAMAHEVRPGPATMLTVLDGDRVEAFQVEIVRVFPQGRRDGRGMIIKVVDPRLLARTEGIVQGMSGSPILQDGRLVGAVTHVFVNDPSRGYGVMAEWMVYEAGIAADMEREGARTTRQAG